MKHLLPALLVIGLSSNGATAAQVMFGVTNSSTDGLLSIVVELRGEASAEPANILAGPLPSGETADVALTLVDGQCVYDLTLTFEGGRSVVRPDVDLCQTDGMVIE